MTRLALIAVWSRPMILGWALIALDASRRREGR
jgi:hypothetical protein